MLRRHVTPLLVEGVEEGVVGGGADDGVRREVVVRLEAADGVSRTRAVDAVRFPPVIAENAQDLLDGPHVGARGLAGNQDAAREDLADDIDRGADRDHLEQFLDLLVEQPDTAMADGIADGWGIIRPVDAVPDP